MFDKELDASLWYILETDKENREKIVKFLMNMPQPLIEEIKSVLFSENERRIQTGCSKKLRFKGSMVAVDGTKYSYEIESEEQEKTLQIIQSLSEEVKDIPFMSFEYELTLVKEYPPYDWKEDEQTWIGDFVSRTCVITNGKNVSVLLNKDFQPYINLNEGEVEHTGLMKELEYEYYLTFKNECYGIQRVFCLKSLFSDTEIDIDKKPEEVTLEYIISNYRDDPKIKVKELPKK